jgi:hypothetical protein
LKTRELLRFYPEIPNGPISEFWHLSKLHFGFDLDMLTPMYVSGSQHFYVKEFSQLLDGTFAIPMRWIIKDGILCADAFKVIMNSEVSMHDFLSKQYSCYCFRVLLAFVTSMTSCSWSVQLNSVITYSHSSD